MFEFIGSLVSGVVAPLFTFLNKKADVDLEKFKVNGHVDQSLLQAHVDLIKSKRDVLMEGLKYQGFRTMQYLFVYPLCLWWASIICYCILHPYFPGIQPVLALPDPLNTWAGGMISFLFLMSQVDTWRRKT